MSAFNLKKKYKDEVVKKLIEKYKYENKMSVPMIKKIVLNRGVGEAVNNSKAIDVTVDQMGAITGQKPVVTRAKKSISNFKIREDQPIGCKVTLRSNMMYDFLSKLINVCIPKIRDFRGVSVKSFDGRGNYTLGLKEDSVFPEIIVDNLDQVRGFDITFVTSATTDSEARDLLAFLGMPFRKN
jgi:large subunit ribosomal protein L5